MDAVGSPRKWTLRRGGKLFLYLAIQESEAHSMPPPQGIHLLLCLKTKTAANTSVSLKFTTQVSETHSVLSPRKGCTCCSVTMKTAANASFTPRFPFAYNWPSECCMEKKPKVIALGGQGMLIRIGLQLVAGGSCPVGDWRRENSWETEFKHSDPQIPFK